MVHGPLGGRAGSRLCGHSRHVRQAGLPPVLIRDRAVRPCTLGCGLCVLTCLVVAWGAMMCRDPTDGDLVIPGRSLVQQPVVFAVFSEAPPDH